MKQIEKKYKMKKHSKVVLTIIVVLFLIEISYYFFKGAFFPYTSN
ncbi:hypothetical protein PI23P_08375 [Polaribacter irgensii 23-P]|uniref:Uncharacterized protein n=1 Tax=Polaribacter irgensii 23-P TaxID=313594 RepID=A4BZN4_9FLAO|nr:hypothetical protein PI23P_08375 [Polaribacter irgensii 23-P]